MDTSYTDLYNNPAELTEEEKQWFAEICKDCIGATKINVLIECADHYRLNA